LHQTDSDAWLNTPDHLLWIFDKLLLSKRLGYICGPAGVAVPKPDVYIVRPCMNLLGMGIGAKFMNLVESTDHLPPGHFWCEVFTGRHISVDYFRAEPILTVEGMRNSNRPLWKFEKWVKLDDTIEFPDQFKDLFETHDYINAEYIDGNLIELHFRTNPDFEHGNSEAIPVWNTDEIAVPEGYEYISKPDYKRKGFYIR